MKAYKSALIIASAAIFWLGCKKDDSSTSNLPTGVYVGAISENTGPVYIYTSQGRVTDPVAINNFILHHSREFVTPGANLVQDSQTFVIIERKAGGDLSMYGGDVGWGDPLDAAYNGSTVILHERDTFLYQRKLTYYAQSAVSGDSTKRAFLAPLVNTYGSYEQTFADPADSFGLITKTKATYQFEYVNDTFLVPGVNVLIIGANFGQARFSVFYPINATPAYLPQIAPGDTIALQQGTVKAAR